jgi:hypothetical protein
MNRKQALDTIRAEYAKHGKETIAATRVYVENPISYDAFKDARMAGMRIYRQAQEATRIFNEAQNDD